MTGARTADQRSPERVAARLEQLRADWTAGQRRLAALEAERSELRETLLRIAGAIQVLEEIFPETARPGATADR
ncbi:MAG: hypothetical protein GC191_00860 [Azospirillum sp.]|nr:hypothetical protein [Azospirillum sp.]